MDEGSIPLKDIWWRGRPGGHIYVTKFFKWLEEWDEEGDEDGEEETL
jgi:hypothetical protein